MQKLKNKIAEVFPTQGALARAARIDETVLSKILNGLREPTAAQRQAIEDALASACCGVEKARVDILNRKACRSASEFAVALLLIGIYDRLGELVDHYEGLV